MNGRAGERPLMRELSLFTGAGGGLLATQHLLGWRTIGYVEWDDYCTKILKARIKEDLLCDAPVYSDLRAFVHRRAGYAQAYKGMVDVITAGFPCQPFSVAGKRRTQGDSRNMWPATRRCIGIIRPQWLLLENVPGLLAGSHGYFGCILRDLARMGFDARWGVLSAAEVGAPHLRKRLWVVAHSKRNRLRIESGWLGREDREGKTFPVNDCETGSVANSSEHGRDAWRESDATEEQRRGQPDRSSFSEDKMANPNSGGQQERSEQYSEAEQDSTDRCACGGYIGGCSDASWWSSEPSLGRVVDGFPGRVDQLRALGNGMVPAVAAAAWQLLTGECP